MADITISFLRICRENIRNQSDDPALREQVVGALRVLDQLIEAAEAPVIPPILTDVLGVRH